ncbi:MAG: hypothetical protein PHV59_08540 [Victivallales bacterium]|nr:hypothetical protein [Victivallales bacterium]
MLQNWYYYYKMVRSMVWSFSPATFTDTRRQEYHFILPEGVKQPADAG